MPKGLNLKLICLSVLIGFSAHAQDDRVEARKHIKDLRHGVLLVKLYTNQNKIEAVQRQGNEKAAQRIRRETDSTNQVFIDQMKAHYSFSEVLYFYSDQSTKIKEGEYDGVLDENLNPVESFLYSKDQVYILDSKYVFFESMQTDQLGISILDYQMTLLERPFPYYVRKRAALFFLRRDEKKMIQKLQENLEAYLKSVG